MDAVVRSRRLVLIAVAALAVTTSVAAGGCGARPPAEPVGESSRPAGGGGARDPKDAGALDGAAALPSDYRSTFTKLTRARFVSMGHAAGRWDVEVWANEPAQKALAARSRDVAVGAIVVAEHFERSGATGGSSGAAGPVMVMEKRVKGYSPEHGDWRYAVVGSAGQLVKDGVVDACAGCHDDAPMDGLFPLAE